MNLPRAHDRGGWPDAGPIDRSEHDPAHWEQRTDALLNLLSGDGRRLLRTDEMRRAIEDLPPDAYESLSYYERWILALEVLLVEKGVLTRAEIEAKVAEQSSTAQPAGPEPPA